MDSNDNIPGIGDSRNLKPKTDYDNLVMNLRNFDEETRILAVQGLGELNESRVITVLLGRFKNDKSPRVRLCAAEVLYKLGDSGSWPILASSLNSGEENENVRAKIAELLGLIGEAQFTAELVKALGDKSKLVWEQAAISLGMIKEPSKIQELISHLNRRAGNDVVAQDTSAYKMALVMMGQMVVKMVLLSSSDNDYRSTENVGLLFNRSTVTNKRKAENKITYGREFKISNGEQPFFKDRVEILSQIGIPAIPIIKETVTSQKYSQALIEIATLALGKIQHVEALNLLCDFSLTSQFDSVRWLAINEIKGTYARNPEKTFVTLTKIVVNEKESVIRENAIEGLGRLGNPKAVPLLGTVLLDDADNILRGAAAKSLGALHSPDALNMLVSALGTDRDTYVQIESATSLGEINNREALPYLWATAQDDPNDQVRDAAKDALSKYE